MKKEKIIEMLNSRKDRSAWDKGVTVYAHMILENVPEGTVPTKELLLNGADSWEQYSYGGCVLVYDCDIAETLCTTSELKKTKGGVRNPNSHETWLDVQTRALRQACARIMFYARMEG